MFERDIDFIPRDTYIIAIDRLIYQADNCRIFHFVNRMQYQEIRNLMESIPNRINWILEYEVIKENDLNKGYLIYYTDEV